jgi:hypothetical protein
MIAAHKVVASLQRLDSKVAWGSVYSHCCWKSCMPSQQLLKLGSHGWRVYCCNLVLLHIVDRR